MWFASFERIDTKYFLTTSEVCGRHQVGTTQLARYSCNSVWLHDFTTPGCKQAAVSCELQPAGSKYELERLESQRVAPSLPFRNGTIKRPVALQSANIVLKGQFIQLWLCRTQVSHRWMTERLLSTAEKRKVIQASSSPTTKCLQGTRRLQKLNVIDCRAPSAVLLWQPLSHGHEATFQSWRSQSSA